MSQASSSSRGGRGWGRGGNWKGRGWGRGRGRGNYFNHYGNNQRGRGNQNFSQNSGLMVDPVPRRQPVQARLEIISPYKGWKFYFPNEGYSDHSPIVKSVELFEKYFISWSSLYNWSDIEVKGFFTVNFKDFSTDQIIQEAIPDLSSEVKNSPETLLSCIGLAMHQIITQHHEKEAADAAREAGESLQQTSTQYTVPMIHARILNFSQPIPLKNLKANCYGKFVCVKGTVVRVGNIKPLCMTMGFECAGCGTMQCVALPDGKYIMPTKCPSTECRSRLFIPKRSSSFTETIDWQTIRVQEIIGDGQKESGRIPRTVDCELTFDLVDSCVPGDIVTISGTVKVNSIDEGRGRNKDKCMFLLYLHANSVNNLKGNKSGGEGSSGLAMDFTMKELYAIEEIQSEPSLFRLLVGSLCPTIYGHELVKAGLILGLFGGSQKYANDKNRIPVRGDPHILIVGDPGLGKSQMLTAAANIAPRSVYVCGNTTTTSGLTVTMSKDGGSSDFALEAGALVLADQGACCIDEFDKMTSQHQALLEAMEQQSISIAKAGIICSLPARTSILAAANPVGGHYNKAKTVSENLKMGSALLSRFDLVFILLDKPDEEMDGMLSDHVMALHGGHGRMLSGATAKRGQDLDDSSLQWEADKPLSERLKPVGGEPFDPIPHQLLRKYVGYARKYVHPKIGPEAAKLLQNFYLDLRKRHQTQDSTPITTRQLESLIRLSEARARLELREVATVQDAEDVIEIMKYSMVDTYSDQYGWIDFKRSQHGSGMSGRSQPKRFIAALKKVAEQTYNSIFTIQQMRQIAKDISLQLQDFEGFVSSLNNQGYLLKKGSKVYQLQTFG
ncbi:LOW QUALITY PROTEIN: DNA helicase MCM8-like [Gigantopelta aegis]|uniref:LOW QUALITY PROTEIN: DNA helicase MCM8-like n=1 Tax=Gigantopelta aegis TaxID=1735272 RepID=UPI001B88C5A1|nr:LOW QUALITY PROTEIN: DNA helicase MCM8-like [Gigantopelta aegis]